MEHTKRLKELDLKFQELLVSCNNGAVRKIDAILKEFPVLVNSYTPFLETPLHIAASAGHISICAFLISKGGDPDAVNVDGWNALHFAAKAGKAEIIEHFITEKIIKIETKTYFDQTPLFIAFEFCKPESAFVLLENNADTEATDVHGDTPFGILRQEDSFHRRFLSELVNLAMDRKSAIVFKHIIRCRTKDGKLDLSHMDITYFSDEAGEVLQEHPTVQELDLSHNKLNTLPCSLKVPEVNIDKNPCDAIPEGFRKPWSKTQAYLESVKSRSTRWTECKLLFVGQEGVGKTTLLSVFKSKSGKVNCKTNLSTNGMSITTGINLAPDMEKKDKRKSFLHSSKSKKRDGVVTFNCWDLGGQEVFYPTHQFFLTSNSVYILAFNAVKPEQSRIEYWMRQIRSLTNNSTKAPVFLVGTHCDHSTCTEEYLQQIGKTYARSFARSRFRGMQGVFFVSSKTGAGISELKERIYSVVTGKNFQPYVAPSWVRLHDLIQIYKVSNDIVEWDVYTKWAENSDIRTYDELILATEFLAGVGSLIHFHDRDSKLNELVILNPQWLADVMSSLITFKHSWVKDGMLPLSSIPQVFKKYPQFMHDTILSLLERFNIIHTLSPENCTFIEDKKIVVSSMLPEEVPPTFLNAWSPRLPNNCVQQGKQYIFPFLPLGFFNRLMIRLLHIPMLQGTLFWRNGMVISYLSQSGYLRFDPDAVEFTVIVRTPHHLLHNRYLRDCGDTNEEKTTKRENLLLRLITDAVDTLIESFRMGTIQRLVACSHCYSKGNDPPFYFTFMECVEAITSGTTTLYCEHKHQKNMAVSIESIAPDIAFSDIPLINSADLNIGKEIGRGAFGVVYEGDWLDTRVAIKQLSASYVNDEAFSEFQQEVFIMSQLYSPFLVALRGVTLIPKLMMVLEYLPCGDLYQLLHPPSKITTNAHQINTQIPKKDFPWKLRLLFALDIARGLQALQTNSPPIAHRDLRSPNIFLCSLDETAPVRAKVADFGLARTVAPRVYGALDTWQWIAPEAIFEGDFDLRSDIYSMGICFWEIASRSYPFDEFVYHPSYSIEGPGGDYMLDQMKIKRAVVNEGLRPSAPEPAEECPEEFMQLITECWDAEPSKRPHINDVVTRLSKMTEIDLSQPLDQEYIPVTPRATVRETISLGKENAQKHITLDLSDLRSEDSEGNWLTSRAIAEKLQKVGITMPTSPHEEENQGTKQLRKEQTEENKQEKKKSKSSEPFCVPVKRSATTLSLLTPQKQPISINEAAETSTDDDTDENSESEDKSVSEEDQESSHEPLECCLFTAQSKTLIEGVSVIATHIEFSNIFLATNDGLLIVYSLNDMSLVKKWMAHEAKITAMLCVKPRILRESAIWTGDDAGMLRIWAEEEDYGMKQEWKPFSRRCEITLFCLFTGRGSKVWVGSHTENEISIFDTDSVQLLHILHLENKQTPRVISQVRQTVWVGTDRGNIVVYTASSVLSLSWAAHPSAISGICETGNESVWSCCEEGTLSQWRFSERKIEALRTIEVNQPILSMCSVSSFNAVWCIGNGAITVWNSLYSSPTQEIEIPEENDSRTTTVIGHGQCVVTLSGNTLTKWIPSQ